MQELNRQNGVDPMRVCLSKLDGTHDFAGTFYALGDWRKKHAEILKGLEGIFDTLLDDPGNSMPSCFQFQERAEEGQLCRRIKVYNKVL